MKHDDDDLIRFLRLGLGHVTDMYLWALAKHATQSHALPSEEPCFLVTSGGGNSAKVGSSLKTGTTFRDGDDCPTLVVVTGGSFEMGGSKHSDEQPIHTVHLAPFAMGKHPVTQAEWIKLMDDNPSRFTGDDRRPVDNVSWNDAQAYIEKLKRLTGHAYRLPSEAEWEYACRAGSKGEWCFGNDERRLGEYSWYDANSGDQTHPVGQKKPNAGGLYNMHGNVWEWCEDTWHACYLDAPEDGLAWITQSGVERVLRGGSWYDVARINRSAYRNHDALYRHFGNYGFRVARSL